MICFVFFRLQGQLNSIAPAQDSFFANQQAMPGLVHYKIIQPDCRRSVISLLIYFVYCLAQGQMDFRPPPNFTYNLQVSSAA